MRKTMKAISVPISKLKVACKIPTAIPVQFEFKFCEQNCEQIVDILGAKDIDILDALDLQVIPYARRKHWLRVLGANRRADDDKPGVQVVRQGVERGGVSRQAIPTSTKPR